MRYSKGLVPVLAVCAFAYAGVAPCATLDTDVQLALPALDRAALAREDAQLALAGSPPRFAVAKPVLVTPANAGEWTDDAGGMRTWRYRVTAVDATSLNFGFSRFHLPPSASLVVRSADDRDVRGPFTHADEDAHGQLWTPVVRGGDAIIELRVGASEAASVELVLAQVGQGYREIGSNDDGAAKSLLAADPATAAQCATPTSKDAEGRPLTAEATGGIKSVAASGACEMDIACLDPGDPWRRVGRASAVITKNGTLWCSASLLNNTANDRRMLLATATHCGINAANAPTLIAYWNYENSTCRVPGSVASGSNGDGTFDQFTTGATLVAATTPSDLTLVELDDPADPSFNLYWAGWDATPYVTPGGPGNGDHACSAGAPCASIHHPSTSEKRITFVEQNLVTTSYNVNTIPGDRTHIHAYWDPTPVFPPNPGQPIPPGVTEGGSSGGPLYNAQYRFVGQLHGGPSSCGATGENLSDYFGRFSVSYAVPAARAALDPLGTNALVLDGRAQCANQPAVPGNVVATPGAANQVSVTWSGSAGATSYDVYRASGACPATSYERIATGVAATNYSDTTVSGGTTYSYRVAATGATPDCVSLRSACDDATPTGVCRLEPVFAGATSAASAGTGVCGVNVAWTAGASSCGGGSPTYSVFRSTNPTFTPASANRVAQCVAGTSFADSTVQSGQRYYYVVRAEDTTANGAGACNLGNVDDNVVVRSSVPAGALSTAFTDTMEGTLAAWTVAGSGDGANFALVNTAAHAGAQSAFAPAPPALSERTLTTASAFTPTAGGTFEFWHRYAGEQGFDGFVLEYSTNGTTWFDILAGNGGTIAANPNRFIEGAYNAFLDSGTSANVLAGRAAWSGLQNTFTRVRVDLSDFAGTSMRIRFRLGTDGSFAPTPNGWWIDDVVRSDATSCVSQAQDTVFANGFE